MFTSVTFLFNDDMIQNNNNLTVLTEAERSALYEAPDFNEDQRYEFLTLTPIDLELAKSRSSGSARLYCCLQIAYFKSVKLFFNMKWSEVSSKNTDFIIEQYFYDQDVNLHKVSDYEHYTVCATIAEHYGFKLWSSSFGEMLENKAHELAKININHKYIAMELFTHLNQQQIIRPQYTTIQNMVIKAVNSEKVRITKILQTDLSDGDTKLILTLVSNHNTLSELAALKQDAKDFKPRMLQQECRKLNTMRPVYLVAKRIISKLTLSKVNIANYAELVDYYTIYDLRQHIKIGQAYLYILCYIYHRFQKVMDNLIISFCYHQRQAEDKIAQLKLEALAKRSVEQKSINSHIKKITKLYVDDELADDLEFGDVRQKAFDILDKPSILKYLAIDADTEDTIAYWESVDKLTVYLKSNIRGLINNLDFFGNKEDLLDAIDWLKALKTKKNITDFPEIPPKHTAYLTKQSSEEDTPVLILNRYEFWVYRKLLNAIKDGDVYFKDSLQYRNLSDELVPASKKDQIIKQLSAVNAKKPISKQLHELMDKSAKLWKKFNKELKAGNLKHLYYDEKTKTLHLKRSMLPKQQQITHNCYESLPFQDIVNISKTVHKACNFLSAFTHIQPRYTKAEANTDHLLATILGQAMNNGNLKMAEISNIAYHTLHDTYISRIRLDTLIAANNIISNNIAQMPIFQYYSFELGLLYGAVDGQKFSVATPNIKARHSKKYFGKGVGVTAYSLLCNHVPLQTYLLGTNDHESYFAFDIWYNNSSAINPQVVTGDMHIINKANSVVMYWFDSELYPRFTNINSQRDNLYCGEWLDKYDNYLIKPRAPIDYKLIEEQAEPLERIIATLGSGEVSQASLIRKLCTYKQERNTREALYELDKLVRSNQILQYLLDPNIISNTHRSQNRLESYHQLRATIAQAYGKKQLIGKTDIELAIANQCGRLVANIIIHYNSMILSKLYDRYTAENNQKALKVLKKISPVAWQHIHFQGRLTFSDEALINLDGMVKKIDLMAN